MSASNHEAALWHLTPYVREYLRAAGLDPEDGGIAIYLRDGEAVVRHLDKRGRAVPGFGREWGQITARPTGAAPKPRQPRPRARARR